MDKLKERDRFLEKFSLPRLNKEEIEIMNNPTASTETEAVMKKRKKKNTKQTNKQTNKQKNMTRWLHRRILSNI